MGAAGKGAYEVRVLLNALSIKEGGPQVVLTHLLSAMQAIQPEVEWFVIVNPRIAASLSDTPSTRKLIFPWAERSPFHLFYWYEVTLPGLVKRLRPDVLFSQTNYLPDRPLECPTLLLEQHAGHFSAEFDRLMMEHLGGGLAAWAWRRRGRWVRRSVKAASLLTVQTVALADAIADQTGLPRDRIAVIPHGPGQVAAAKAPRQFPRYSAWRIGYLTKPGVQKNFCTLFRAIRDLRRDKRDVTLALTLDQSSEAFVGLWSSMRELCIEGCVVTHGDVMPDQVQDIYDSVDVFVFPSICESFGFPMVEAMARGVPIVVAATPSNLEVTGAAALSFRSDDHEGLAACIRELMDDPKTYEARSEMSLARCGEFSWKKTAKETLAAMERLTEKEGDENGPRDT